MTELKSWWVVSDPSHPANQPPKEQPMALDDQQPQSDTPSWAQSLHDRLCAIEAWIKERMPGGAPEPAPEVAPPAQDPNVEGVG